VFRRAYAAVGFGWLVAPTRWPLVRPLADAAYRWFARNRLRLTGRGEVCSADRCTVHAPGASDSRAARRSGGEPALAHRARPLTMRACFRTPRDDRRHRGAARRRTSRFATRCVDREADRRGGLRRRGARERRARFRLRTVDPRGLVLSFVGDVLLIPREAKSTFFAGSSASCSAMSPTRAPSRSADSIRSPRRRRRTGVGRQPVRAPPAVGRTSSRARRIPAPVPPT